SNPWWRLNHLYKIQNEKGELVTFRMRPAQRQLFRNMHNKNIILKARQLGFSTAIDIYLLDQALFIPHLKCGIVAQDKQAASEIFRTKIAVPFDHLPDWLRASFTIVERRSGASGGYILFGHGSSIQVATSFRSGTVQRLHISEHGKICAKYPAKAKELRTGTLNAVSDECIIFDESTAEGVGGDFYDMSNRAQEITASGLLLTAQDYKFHFYAWWQDPKYSARVPESGLKLSREKMTYFSAVEKAMNITLTDEQK
ncbi:terminase, partial [Escherichia coli]